MNYIRIQWFDSTNKFAPMGEICIAVDRIIAFNEERGHTAIAVDGLTRTIFTDEPVDILMARLKAIHSEGWE